MKQCAVLTGRSKNQKYEEGKSDDNRRRDGSVPPFCYSLRRKRTRRQEGSHGSREEAVSANVPVW